MPRTICAGGCRPRIYPPGIDHLVAASRHGPGAIRRGAGGSPALASGASAVSRLNLTPPDFRLPAPGRENPGEGPGNPCAREAPPKDLRQAADNLRNSARQLASRPLPGGDQNLPVKPASSGWLPSQCPLPPASVFFLQTNFRKYLETWPTPGSTATGDWPEYIPEDEDNLE
jgi:hypothetical protein